MAERIPVIAIVGPTASGKSAYAIRLAEEQNGEIISGDSMQIYRGMDIGTAKATPEQRARIPHHLLDIADISEAFSAGAFIAKAKEAINDISSRGKLPIVCGGTGLYIELLLTGKKLSDSEKDEQLRDELFAYAAEHGNDALHAILKDEDPEEAEKIHPNNVKRVVRAIEICRTSGMTKTEADRLSRTESNPYLPHIIRLSFENREALYERIAARVSDMFSQGLENEVRCLCTQGLRETPTASQAIGYKEFYPYFDGMCSLDDVKENIILNTRHYAKRQETWFSRMHSDEMHIL